MAGKPAAALHVGENATAVTLVTANPAAAGDTLTYAIVKGSDAALFAIDAASGMLTLADGGGGGGLATGDTFSGFENLAGSAFHDALLGHGGNNRIWVGASNDLIDRAGDADWRRH